MKTLKIIIFLLSTWTFSYGQDGSDIRYFKPYGIDNSIVGEYVQFDFYNRSFGGRPADTLIININGRPIKFIEKRKDDGFNNWFSQQLLQSVDKIEGKTIQIQKCRLDSIDTNSFYVTMYVDFYDAGNKLLVGRSEEIKYEFSKKDITEVLVKSKQR